MTIKIDLRKILQEAQNKAQSGIPMDEAISMAVWDHCVGSESANTAMALVSTALLEFDSGKAGTLEEAVQNMLQAIETSSYPRVITSEIESELEESAPPVPDSQGLGKVRYAAADAGLLRHQTASPIKLESGIGKLILLFALAALVYWLF